MLADLKGRILLARGKNIKEGEKKENDRMKKKRTERGILANAGV